MNSNDLIALLGRFGQAVEMGTPGDLNADGSVDALDLTLLLVQFGNYCL